MSHRESCVWHPMPDEVRRSSVQSRRASLAAGRRKQMQDEPDWEVEAPPTPPPNDYSPRQEAAQAEARAADKVREEEAAAAAAAAAAAEEAAAESREPVEEARHEPVEEKSAAEAAREREVAEAEAAAAAGEASVEEESVAVDGKRAKTRHTIRFRGDKWSTVTDEAARKEAFEHDVADIAGLKAEELSKLKFEVEPDMMVATFYLHHPASDRQKMQEVHHKFQEATFEHTCALYPE